MKEKVYLPIPREKVYLPMPHFAAPNTPPVYLKHDVEAALARAGIEFEHESPDKYNIRMLKEELHRVKEAAKRTEEALRACNDRQGAKLEALVSENQRLKERNQVLGDCSDRQEEVIKKLQDEVARLLKESTQQQMNKIRAEHRGLFK